LRSSSNCFQGLRKAPTGKEGTGVAGRGAGAEQGLEVRVTERNLVAVLRFEPREAATDSSDECRPLSGLKIGAAGLADASRVSLTGDLFASRFVGRRWVVEEIAVPVDAAANRRTGFRDGDERAENCAERICGKEPVTSQALRGSDREHVQCESCPNAAKTTRPTRPPRSIAHPFILTAIVGTGGRRARRQK
jgi:hypothetical protein